MKKKGKLGLLDSSEHCIYYCLYLVLFPVNIRHSPMRKKDVVGDNVGLSRWISSPAEEVEKDRASSWCVETYIITLNSNCMRLIECDPMLYPVTINLKACLCECCKVLSANYKDHLNHQNHKGDSNFVFASYENSLLHDLGAEPSIIFVLQGLRKVPMV